MHSVDILLINPPTSRTYKKDLAGVLSMPPLGLMYIASHAIKNGYTVKLIDAAVDYYKKDEFIETIRRLNPRIVGISTFVESWSAIKAISHLIKSEFPELKIIAGGACATFCYEQLLKELDFDYVIFGEGEYTFVNLCNAVLRNQCNLNEVKGIALKTSDGIIRNESCERIQNLDELEIPDRDLIDFDKYVYPITLSTARGCPGACIFCSSRSFWGREIYYRTAENILKEVLFTTEKYHHNMFFIVDDAFTLIPERAIKFCELLKATGKRFIWGCESRADVASKNLLENLYEAGCRKIQFGMESGNNEILKKIGKLVTVEQIEDAVKIASKIGFDINVSFIMGHSYDTHETVQQTIKFALMLKEKYGANIFGAINTPYPGTYLHRNHERLGVEILTNDWNNYTMDNAIINTNNLKASDLREYYQKFVNYLLGIDKELKLPKYKEEVAVND